MAWFKKAGVSNGPVTTFSAGNHIEGYQESIDRRKQEEEEARRQREAAIELARQQREQAQRESEARMAKAGNDRTTAIKQPGLIQQGNSLLINPYAQGNTAATGADIDYSKINEKAKTDKAYKGLNGTEIGKRIMGNGITQEESLAHAADVMKPYQNNEKAMKALDRYVTLDNERTRGMFGRFESGMSYSGQFDKLANEFIEETGVSMDEFRKIAASYSQLKNASDRKQQQEEYAKMSNSERVAKSIVKAPTNILGSYQAFLGNLQDTVDPELGRDYNSEFYRLANENTDIRKAQNDAIEKIENPVLKTVAHFGYNAAVMGAESATAALTGEAGLASFFASGYNQGLQDAENRGLTPEQAQAYALSMGGFEYFTERIPWEGLRNIYAGNAVGKDAVKGSIMPYIKALFKQVGEEAGEEVINGVGETLADAVIAADKSNLNLNIQRYMQEDGLTESEATRKAIWDVVKDTADAAITAALSAGVSAGPALTGQAYSVAKSGRNIAATENNTGTFTRNENSPNYIPTTRESYLANEDYVKAQDTRQSILNASEKAAKGQKISGKEARALYESLSDTYGNLEQAERVRAQKVFEEARAKAEDKAIEEIKQAKTASEVETIKESFVNSERVNEAVEEKKSQMLDQGKATEEDFNQAITPSKAQKMGYEGKEIAADELENLPKRVKEAYELGYSQKANEITKNATKLDVIQIQEKEGGKVEKIKSVSKDSNGVLQFETTSGKKINAAEAIYSDRGKYYFEGKNGILSLDEPALVQLAIDAASTKRGVQVGSLTSALKDMYTLGETGLDFDAAINKLDYSVKTIGKDILKSAFDEGAKLATATSRATNAAVGDGLIREATEGLEEAYKAQFVKTTNEGVVFDENALNAYENDVTDAEKKFLELLSKKIKVNIAFTYNNSTKDRGQYRPDEGKIYLNLAMNKDFFETALHEGVGEFLAASNEKAYNQIVDSVLNAYASTNASQLAKNIRAYQKAYSEDKYGDTARGASRELFNDALGEIFSSEENIKKMFDWMIENEGVEKAEQVKKTLVDYIKDLITIIKQLRATGKLTKLEDQKLTLTEKQANDFVNQILKAMDEAIANRDNSLYNNSGNTEVRNSLRVQGIDSYTEKEIENWSNSKTIIVAQSEQDVIDFYNNNLHKKTFTKLMLGKIGSVLGARIKKDTGIDITGYNICINSDFEDHHGNAKKEAKLKQVVIDGKELARLPEYLANYTSVEVSKTTAKNNKPRLQFESDVNGHRVIIENVSDGQSSIILQTMYGRKSIEINKTPHQGLNADAYNRTSETSLDMESLFSDLSISSTDNNATPKQGPKSINVEKLKETARHSFAGIGSETADMTQLSLAEDMRDEGIDEETILATTGWFLGMDNQWKYEISDNDLIIFKDGNAKFLRDNKDFNRYNQLMDKIFFKNMDYTEDEYDELVDLEEKVLRPTQENGWLSDFVQHDKLFEAYPFLEGTYVDFVDFEDSTVNGSADIYNNGIHLNKNFHTSVSNKWSEDAMKSVLLHEIQHLIQRSEDFANGASPEWWNEIKEMKIADDKKAIEGAQVHLNRAIEGAKKNGMSTSIREFVYDLSDKLDAGEITQAEFGKRMAQFKRSSVYHYENMIYKLQRHIDRLSNDSDNLLYYNTAGEIEARDVSNRAKLTEQQRREYFPKVDDQDVVYIDRGVSGRRFSKKVGDIEQAAIDHFGTTEDFKFAGYMLPDGRLLDFSGAHWLDGASEAEKEQFRQDNGMRQVDHDDIYEVMEASGDNRKQFMDRGNIRLNPEAPGFNVSSAAEPTAAQYRELKEFIREVKKNPYYDASNFYVDIEDTHPNKISYANNLNEDRIINDLKNYYETGEMPQQSSLNDFRYSIKVDWDSHNTYTIPARNYDADNFFDLSDEDMDAAELQDVRVKAYIANIIHSKDFAGFMYSYKTESGHDKTRFLTRSTRDGYDYQFSYMDDGTPIMHSNIKDENDDITAYSNSQDMANFYSEVVHDIPMEGVDIHVIREGVAEDARQSKVVFGEESPYSDALNQAKVIEDVLTTINNQLRGQTVSMPFLNKTVDSIIRKYKADISAEDLTMELAQFIGYMTKAEAVDYNQMMNYLLNVGDEVIKSSKLKDPEEERIYSELKKELSSHKINLTDQEKKELISRYGGSWNTVFGKLNSIGIKLNNAGSHMDGSTYSEIADKFLEIAGVGLDAEVTAVDQIATIIDAMESLAPTAYKWDGATDFDKAMDVAVTIIDSYYSMAASIKEANMAKGTEKGQKAIERAVKTETAKLRAKNEEYKAKLNEEFAQLVEDRKKVVEEQQEFYKRQAEIERQFKGEKREFYRKKSMTDKEIEKTARLQAQMQYQGLKDTEAKRKHKDNIVRTCMRLINWMNKPTDTRHVPSFLQPALTEMIKSINFMPASMRKGDDGTISAVKWQESMRKLQSVIKSIESADMNSMNDSDRYALSLVMETENIVDKMQQLLDKYSGTADISRMSKEDLKTLSDIMTSISKSVSNMNENFLNRRFKHVSEAATAAMDEMMMLKPIADTQGVIKSTMQDFLNLDMAEPITFFEELGSASESIMQEFFDGEKTGIQIIEEADKFFNDLGNSLGLTTKDIRAWENDAKNYNIAGTNITLTSADIMSLYCSYHREMLDQAERPFEATHHISAGGIKGFRHRVGLKEVNKNPQVAHASEGQIMDLINSLSDVQKEYADRVVEYMSTTLAAHGNETSNKLNGYSKFLGKYYFPLKTDTNAIATTESNNMSDQAGFRRLIFPSFTKSQIDKADNALVLMSFFDVVTEHITGMSNYCAYAMPISDAMRWYNYAETERANTDTPDSYQRYTKSIKGYMDRVRGDGARKYFEQFIRDVNLDNKPSGSKASRIISQGLTGLAKAKAVGLNIRVIVQQPCAIIRAADVIEGKYLAEGWAKMSKNPKVAMEYAQDKSYLCYWKSKGFSDTRISQSMKEIITGQESVRQDIVEKTGVLAGLADDITWAAMYYAAEAKVKAETNLREGSDEYNKAIEDTFSDIINHTQVIDSNLRKTGTMRSSDAIEKLANAFKKEPQKSYNMLHRAKWEQIQAKYSGNEDRIKEANKKWSKALTVFIENAFVTAIAQSLVDAWRDDDDEDGYLFKMFQKMVPYESYEAIKDIVDKVSNGEAKPKDVLNLIQGIYGGAGNILDNANIASSIPYVADIDSLLKGYSVTRLDSTSILTQLKNTVTTLGSQNATWYSMLYSAAQLIGYATGVGVDNALKDLRGIYNQWFSDLTGYRVEKNATTAKQRAKKRETNRVSEVFDTNDLSSMKAEINAAYENKIAEGKDESQGWTEARNMLKEQFQRQLTEHPEDKAALVNRYKTLLKYTKKSNGKGGYRDLSKKEIENYINGWTSGVE